MVGALYPLVVTVLLLLALALTIPVVIDILREGIQHQGAWRFSDQNGEHTGNDIATEATADDSSCRTCPSCGATNEPDFTYCQRCAERL